MKRKLKMHIESPKPCDKEWTHMMPGNGGRHCNHCEKTVIDFTSMTDRELVEFFIGAKNKPVCGRFRSSQLDTDILYEQQTASSPFASLAKNIAAGVVLLQALTIDARAQTAKTLQHVVATADSTSRQKAIYGQLLDHITGAPIPGVRFTIENTELYSITDAKGEFNLPVQESVPERFTVRVVHPDDYRATNTEILAQTLTKADIVADRLFVFYRYPAAEMEPLTVIQYKVPLINPYTVRSKTAEEIIKMGGVQGVRIEPTRMEGPIKEKPQIRAVVEPLSARPREHWFKKLFGNKDK